MATNHPRYPLTFDQRLTQADRYREAAEQLNATLQSIEKFYASPSAGLHTGGPKCERCAKKKHRKMQAFYDYFLGNHPGRWDESLVDYRQELEDLFNGPEPPLAAIHLRFKAELRDHLRRDLCTVSTGDSKEILEDKEAGDALLRDSPLEEGLRRVFQKKVEALASLPDLNEPTGLSAVRDVSHPAGFSAALQEARTAEQRAELYVAYYCTPAWNDTPQQRNIKSKYGKLFESGTSHDTVLGMWRKETQDQKAREVGRLKQRLGELQMAQSAHLKNKKRKMEKDARIKDKEYVIVPRLVKCSLRGCDVQIDTSKEGPIECAVCDWLAGRSEERRHFYYCSEAHVEDDFVSPPAHFFDLRWTGK